MFFADVFLWPEKLLSAEKKLSAQLFELFEIQ